MVLGDDNQIFFTESTQPIILRIRLHFILQKYTFPANTSTMS